MTQRAPIREVSEFLAAPGPAILHAVVDPDELPTMPHIEPAQVIRFGIAKVREAWRSLGKAEG